MHTQPFASMRTFRFVTLLLASAAAAALVSGCGEGGGGSGGPSPSAAVSSTPRSAGGLAFTATADHAVYSKSQLIVLTYSITTQYADNPVVSTTGGSSGGWFEADAVSGSQTISLIPGGGPGPGIGAGSEVEVFPLFAYETASYPETASAMFLTPGKWRISCWLAGKISGVTDPASPPFTTNPVTITVLP